MSDQDRARGSSRGKCPVSRKEGVMERRQEREEGGGGEREGEREREGGGRRGMDGGGERGRKYHMSITNTPTYFLFHCTSYLRLCQCLDSDL